MQTILLSLIAGLLAVDIVFKQTEDMNLPSILLGIILVLVFSLIAGAIIFGIAYGINANHIFNL